MKKRKLRKPRKLWNIAECCSDDNGFRWIKVHQLIYPAWFSFKNAEGLAKWFADAAAWVKEGE